MENRESWYKDFFENGWDEVQDEYRIGEQTIIEADFIDEFAKEKEYKKVLDVPCGTGRITIELAKRGYEMTGIDFNVNALGKARKRSKDLNINWLEEDMRNIPFISKFDMITCMWGSIGYFNDEENFKFMKSASEALKPGGAIVLDTHTLEGIMRIYQSSGVTRMKDGFVIEERKYDYETSRINVEWTFIQDGKQFSRTSSIRMYSYKELIDMMKSAGFEEFKSYASFKKENYGVSAARLILCAIKNK